MNLARHRHAVRWLAVISFAESSFFPIPPDVVLAPMVLARRAQAWLIATVCSVSSVAGGVLGYFIGFYLYDTLGQWLIGVYGLEQQANAYHDWYAEWGAALILIKGLTPIPYKLVTIASGVAHFDFTTFLITSMVTRAGRFFLIAALLKVYGEPIQEFIERKLDLVGILFVVALVGGFLVFKFL